MFHHYKKQRLRTFSFLKKLGLIPGFSNYGPSDTLVQAAEKIEQTIRTIDDNYLINTDLSCVLANESLITESDVIPNRNNQTPVIINRPTYWDGTSLSQIIASEGWLSWLTWETIGKETRWVFDVAATQRPAIYESIAQEANYNARINSQTPYFSPWLHNYRSKVFASRAVAYDWFSQIARVNNAPHKKEIAFATVPRLGAQGHTSTDERTYIAARTPIVRAAIPARLGLPNNKYPKIALVASGGGIRAMLATLGTLRGLENTGIMDTITYACGLSGSTWAIGPWIASEFTVSDYCRNANIIEKVARFASPSLVQAFTQRYLSTTANTIKNIFGQPWTFVDVWGLYIAQNLLLQPDMTLSQQTKVINGSKPLPIYTAISIESRARDWFEFTPFEIGALNKERIYSFLELRSIFYFGNITGFPPRTIIRLSIGIFGSAMGARLRDVLGGAGLKNLTAAEWSATHGIVPNFYFGIRDIQDSDENFIKLVDAGADFNCGLNLLAASMRNEKQILSSLLMLQEKTMKRWVAKSEKLLPGNNRQKGKAKIFIYHLQ